MKSEREQLESRRGRGGGLAGGRRGVGDAPNPSTSHGVKIISSTLFFFKIFLFFNPFFDSYLQT